MGSSRPVLLSKERYVGALGVSPDRRFRVESPSGKGPKVARRGRLFTATFALAVSFEALKTLPKIADSSVFVVAAGARNQSSDCY